eukprot:Clim_evm41s156 gene=Clim_evmTU41s156
MSIEAKIEELGLKIPKPGPPKGNYVPCVRSGNLLFLAGHIPFNEDGSLITGKLGADMKTDEGYQIARTVTMGMVATLKQELGDLDKIKRIVKVTGMVNSTPDFVEQPQVLNGCSDLLGEIFGEKGVHCRVAAGFAALPLGVAVEIDMIAEFQE